ncbi:MAG: rhodanese-like domain-containing protein [Ruminococcus sp.]|nr:rhodanese-like domain-containing protein [Ruminococcus sp.]
MKKNLALLISALLLCSCGAGSSSEAVSSKAETTAEDTAQSEAFTEDSSSSALPSENEAGTYKQISQQEAAEMMERDDGHIIVDVRRQDEYDAGHIPGAVLIPNETISDEKPELLPDTGQIILIYCRSGNRSKQASQKLADMGYINVYEFGGINTWPGELTQ